MKNPLLATLAAAVMLSGCATLPVGMAQGNTELAAQAAGKAMKSKPGEGGLRPAKSVGETKDEGKTAKRAATFKVSIPTLSRSLSPSDVRAVCAATLRSMDAAQTWQSGSEIGLSALRNLSDTSQNGDYKGAIFQMTTRAADASKTWEDTYKIVALGLRFVTNDKPYEKRDFFNLGLSMMDQTKTWESGAKVGHAILDYTIWLYDNDGTATLARITNDQARAATTWEDTYKVITSGLRSLAERN